MDVRICTARDLSEDRNHGSSTGATVRRPSTCIHRRFVVSSHLVYKEVLAAPLCTLGLDEAEAFARIEPPYGASSPLRLPFRSALRSAGARDSQLQLLDLLGDLILLILRLSHVRGNPTQCRAIGC